ncbi:hypothetical protein [Enterobacter hormaechei]|uniref:hypothetical protein n=1 Tax=Enterobacter hormaechei TaxID=158836 RepID=UPI001D125E1C|nr:hypothetical protein [Enterobacter hormaechei]MCC2917697.1 hypothetical protein [Enterobacter hormaechei]UDV15078.1 hypothetical protein LJU47_22105 [Enterobacter hormaechei]
MTPNIQAYRADGGDIGTDRIKEIANNPYGDEEKCWLAKRVLALLDELEAKDKAWSAQDNHINQQADRIESLEKKNGELGRALGAAEKRIAELEAREVKLPELCVGVVQGGHAVMVPYAAGHWFNKTAILEMLADSGINIAAAGKGE